MRTLHTMKKKLLLIPFTIIASLAVFGPLASANTMQLNLGNRQSGEGGEFNAVSSDFNPTAMGYAASTTYNGGFETFCIEYSEHFIPRPYLLLRNQPGSHEWRRVWWQS